MGRDSKTSLPIHRTHYLILTPTDRGVIVITPTFSRALERGYGPVSLKSDRKTPRFQGNSFGESLVVVGVDYGCQHVGTLSQSKLAFSHPYSRIWGYDFFFALVYFLTFLNGLFKLVKIWKRPLRIKMPISRLDQNM